MTLLANRTIIAAVFLSYGLLATAKDSRPATRSADGLRRKRGGALKKMKNTKTKTMDGKNDIMDDEDVAFWTRLLVGDRGKETDFQSMPIVSRPPSGVRPPAGATTPQPFFRVTPNPITPAPIVTPNPTRRPTLRPVVGPTPAVTLDPTRRPTPNPTPKPTPSPTRKPTPSPTTETPTLSPTPAPTTSCGITQDERRSQIVDILSVISFPDLFDDPDSPQRKALDWIIDEDGLELCPDDDEEGADSSLVQRYALAVFYYSTNGDEWKQCNAPEDFENQQSIDDANTACKLTTINATTIFPNDFRGTNAWLTPESECLWGGISCYAANTPNAFEVNVVEFENNGLAGTLPAEMEQLTKMRFFALERGALTGPIPSSFGNLQSLLLLDFDFNQLDGPLPSALWTLTSLRQLDLNDNKFSGELSGDIGLLRQLRFFQIDNNMMEGEIPSGLGDVPNFSEYPCCLFDVYIICDDLSRENSNITCTRSSIYIYIGLIGLSGNNFEGAMPREVCDRRPRPLQTLVVDCDIECAIPECCTSCVPV